MFDQRSSFMIDELEESQVNEPEGKNIPSI